MTETVRPEHAERERDFYREQGSKAEQKRIINLLLDLNVVRRCGATNKLVSFDLNGEKVIYLPGIETEDK
jgi:hypothetical protein